MKKTIVVVVLLTLMCCSFIVFSCSSRVENTNTNSNADAINSPSTTASPTPSANPSTIPTRTLDDEAQNAAKEFWDERMAKCGDKYYWAPNDYPAQTQYIYQCKYEPSVGAAGAELTPRSLTEAERLNGVDPLPIAWEGEISMTINICRKFYEHKVAGTVYPSNGWSQWEDQITFTARMKNAKGKWEIDEIQDKRYVGLWKVRPIKCPAVDKYLKYYNLEG